MTKTELKNWKHFLLRLVLFLLLVIALDFIVGSVLDYYYWNHNGDKNALHLQYALTQADQQLIVMGSSHAKRGIDPAILQQKLGLTSYNASQAAQSILFQDAILPVLLKRHQPEVLLLEIASWELERESIHYDRLAFLLPYYNKYPEVRPTIELRSRFERLKLLSHIYPYNSDILTIMRNLFSSNNAPLGNGFETHQRLMTIDPGDTLAGNDTIMFSELPAQKEIDSFKVKAFHNFFETASENGVRVVVVMTPVYKPYVRNRRSLELIDSMLAKYNVPLLNFSHDPEFIQHPEWFYDGVHLNAEGAPIFSAKLADSLEVLLNRGITDSTAYIHNP